MAIDVKRGLEQREFLLSNDKEFHRQIHSIKRTSNGGKYFRYDAERNEKGHADSFWAWALENSAVSKTDKKSDNFYEQRRRKRQEFIESDINKKHEIIHASLEEKKALWQQVQDQEAKQKYGDSVQITKGKSLKQVNMKFGYEKPDKENW